MTMMNEQEVMKRLQDIFRDVLGKPDLIVLPEMDSSNLEGWDSLAHISLLEAVQQEFSCRFGLEERMSLFTVESIIKAIMSRC